jgi:hypothetical protein
MIYNYKLLTSEQIPILRSLFRYVCIICLTLTMANGQNSCPNPGGGYRDISLSDGASERHFYPASLPATVTYGIDKSTAGYMNANTLESSTFTQKVLTIHPELGNGAQGSVILTYMNLLNIDAFLLTVTGQKVSDSGVTTHTVTAADLDITQEYIGPVTVHIEKPVPGGTGSADIYIRFMTGDQVFNSCYNRKVAVWTDFIQPNSHIVVDDMQHSDWLGYAAPICTATFGENRMLNFTELSMCLDEHDPAGGTEDGYYPGKVVFNYNENPDHDIDRDGDFDGDDRLKTARIIWMLSNAATTSREERRALQNAIWNTQKNTVDHTFTVGSIAANAQIAVPALPNPVEPTFSVSAPSVPASPGNSIPFNISFNIDDDPLNPPSFSKSVKLVVPAGLSIGAVTGTGVTYNAGTSVLTFASLPGVATISVTSSTSQTAKLTAIYEDSRFWNITKLDIYNSCDPNVQDFIGLSRGEIITPYREASATWVEPNTYDISSIVANPLSLCNDNEVKYTFTAINNGPSATGTGEKLIIALPKPILFDGAVTGISNFPSGALPTLTSDASFNYYSWTLPTGVAAGGSMSFSVSLVAGQPDLLSCGSITVKEEITYATCDSSDPYCIPVSVGENNSTQITISKPQLTITGFTAVQNIPGTLSGSLNVTNGSTDPALDMPQSGTLTIFRDVNGNGVIDAGDIEVGTQSVTINQGASQTIDYNVSTTFLGDLCPALVKLDVECACSNPAVFVYTTCETSLPVNLVSFDANKSETTVKLKWSTSNESNSDRFEILRSQNGSDWKHLDTVVSAGKSEVVRNYTFTDNTPLAGANYYRLKMIDQDETFAYSRIVSVRFMESLIPTFIYPNPSSGVINLGGMDLTKVALVEVVDWSGKVVSSHTTPVSSEGLKVKSVMPGTYLVRITETGGTIHTHKIVIIR